MLPGLTKSKRRLILRIILSFLNQKYTKGFMLPWVLIGSYVRIHLLIRCISNAVVYHTFFSSCSFSQEGLFVSFKAYVL
ncbi:hypothetical protein RHGRI_003138 [Rhododendron griersonianum]|uniref:Uncharacterized protein n=1 Tax=Rhododendron griersonianum TaxID=479676 RepID=A0AAV6LSN7_9ERIC|nr:hypothetical protein RHGRI_003138 [Rhododendron griersonianum]